MKRIVAATAVACLLAGASAHAQQTSPFYGELGYTFLKIDAAGTSTRPDAIRGILGFDVHPMFAVEGVIAGGVNDDDKEALFNGAPAQVQVKMDYMYGLFVKPKYGWGQAEVFARLGWAHTNVKVQSSTPSLAGSTSDDDLAWGIGGNFNLNPRMYVGADWMRYSNQSNHKVDGFTVSFGYRW